MPDDDDIKYTNYYLTKCSKCGEMACDLCCGISGRELANLEEGESWTKHLICDVCSGATPMGNKRKFWLKEEYEK